MNQLNQFNGAASGDSPQVLAIASIPCQRWNGTYDLATALQEGTLFPELNKPFYLGGREYGR